MRALDRLLRRWQLRALARLDPRRLQDIGRGRLVRQVGRVARRVPAYAQILRERKIEGDRLRTLDDVLRHCPILAKEDLFGRFPLHELCVDGNLKPLSNVLTSSGHGSRFAFGLSTARQGRAAAKAIDLGLEHAFQTDAHPTLLINALPMGVRFASTSVTIAETSVREDMVCALVREVAPYYAQTILVLDPLFCKRLLDYGRDIGLDWVNFKIHVILGEETFGEHFRAYVSDRLGQDPTDWTRGQIISSMGVGEVGLNLFFETSETLRLRQLAHRQPEALADAIGPWSGRTPPLLFVHDPRRLFVEITDADSSGFGALTVSTLDPALLLPLIRYRTGDRAKLLDRARMAEALKAAGHANLPLPALPMIAVAGRDKDFLPDGRALLDIKDALYADPWIADQISGAFRVSCEESQAWIHVQMRSGWTGDGADVLDRLGALLPQPDPAIGDRLRLWKHDEFPFGRTLDYERKFNYYPVHTGPKTDV